MTRRALQRGLAPSLDGAPSKREESGGDLGQLSGVQANSVVRKRMYGNWRAREC